MAGQRGREEMRPGRGGWEERSEGEREREEMGEERETEMER